ncbi:MAG: DUF4446 family protein [Abditibacteriota bacterium]|nr:DUF4446 family protein [Abditibacteriota bacterium]
MNIFLTILICIMVLYLLVIHIQVSKLYKYRRLKLEEGTPDEIVSQVENLMEILEIKEAEINTLKAKVALLEKDAKSPIKKIGIHRYDVADTGGAQSFSLALLNEENKGVIIRGMFTREISRFYCIKVDKDGSDKELQEEDIIALKNAVTQ